MRKGNVAIPPRAMKLPAAKGDQWKGDRLALEPERTCKGTGRCAAACARREWEDAEGDGDGPEAPKTGMLDSHAPRMKKQVKANQHIVTMTPHWRAEMPNLLGDESDWDSGAGS